MANKTWNDFTNEELVKIYSSSFNFELKMKIMAILKKRGVSLRKMYYGTYDPNAKGE